MPFKRYGMKAPHKEFKDQWTNSTIERKIEAVRSYPENLLRIARYCPLNGKILESGCGLGGWVIHLSRLGYKITGIDFVESAN